MCSPCRSKGVEWNSPPSVPERVSASQRQKKHEILTNVRSRVLLARCHSENEDCPGTFERIPGVFGHLPLVSTAGASSCSVVKFLAIGKARFRALKDLDADHDTCFTFECGRRRESPLGNCED